MNVCQIPFRVVGLYLVWSLTVLSGAAAEPGVERERLLAELRSPDAATSSAAITRLRDDRRAVIDAMLVLVRQGDQRASSLFLKYQAVRILGEFRAAEAAGELVRQVEFTTAYALQTNSPLAGYPAAEALVALGAPAIRAISNRLATPVTDRELKLLAYVIYCIDGEELGLARLEHMQRKEIQRATPAKQADWRRLVETYRACRFADMRDWPRPDSARARKPARDSGEFGGQGD